MEKKVFRNQTEQTPKPLAQNPQIGRTKSAVLWPCRYSRYRGCSLLAAPLGLMYLPGADCLYSGVFLLLTNTEKTWKNNFFGSWNILKVYLLIWCGLIDVNFYNTHRCTVESRFWRSNAWHLKTCCPSSSATSLLQPNGNASKRPVVLLNSSCLRVFYFFLTIAGLL